VARCCTGRLEQFLTDVYFGDLDALFLDLPPGTGDIAISVAQLLPKAQILVVTTPQAAAADVAERAGAIATQTGQTVAGVMENMSYLETARRRSGWNCSAAAAAPCSPSASRPPWVSDVPLLGQIPLRSPLREGGDSGKPLVLAVRRLPAAVAYGGDRRQVGIPVPRGLKGMPLGLQPR
jgi:ATP-binding protein involved in chromosome partitioning